MSPASPSRVAGQDAPGSLRGALDLLSRARALSCALERRSLSSVDLGWADAEALLRLAGAKSGKHTMSQLAEASGFIQSGLSRVVDRLERRGLAMRSKDGLDRRRMLVAVTPLGLTVANDLLASLQQESAVFAGRR